MKNNLLRIKLTLIQQKSAIYSVLDFKEYDSEDKRKSFLYTLGYIEYVTMEVDNLIRTIEIMHEQLIEEISGTRVIEEDDIDDIYELLLTNFTGDMRGDLKPLSTELQQFINTYSQIKDMQEEFLSGIVEMNVTNSNRQIETIETVEALNSWNEWVAELKSLIENKSKLSKIIKMLQ